jgi:hypothetical protein
MIIIGLLSAALLRYSRSLFLEIQGSGTNLHGKQHSSLRKYITIGFVAEAVLTVVFLLGPWVRAQLRYDPYIWYAFSVIEYSYG